MKRTNRDGVQEGSPLHQLARFFLWLASLMTGGLLGLLAGQAIDRAATANSQPPVEAKPLDYETRDLPVGAILRAGFLLVGAGAVVLIAITLVQYWWMGYIAPPIVQPPSLETPQKVTLPPPPRFEAIPGAALDQLHTGQLEQLESYGWVDQKAGIVHIPIDRAMDLMQVQGFPIQPEAATKTFDSAGNELPSSSSSGRRRERVYP